MTAKQHKRQISPFLYFTVAVFLVVSCNPVNWHRDRLKNNYADAGIKPATVRLTTGRMHVLHGGKGEPLLLIHGFGLGALETWEEQAEEFAGKYYVIAPDLYWFGKSQPDNPDYPAMAEDQAAAIGELLDVLKIDKVHVLGVSFGGYVALEFADLYPDRVDKLILVDAAGITPTAAEEKQIRRNFDNPQNLEKVLLPENVESFQWLLKKLFYKPRWIPDFALNQILEEDIMVNREAKARICRRLTLGPLMDISRINAIQAETLVAWGRHDVLLLPSMGERLAGAITHSKLVFFEKSGHTPMLEESEGFNRVVLEFLEHPKPY